MTYGSANVDAESAPLTGGRIASDHKWKIASTVLGVACGALLIAVIALSASQTGQGNAANAANAGVHSHVSNADAGTGLIIPAGPDMCAGGCVVPSNRYQLEVSEVRGNLPQWAGHCDVDGCRLEIAEMYFYDQNGEPVVPDGLDNHRGVGEPINIQAAYPDDTWIYGMDNTYVQDVKNATIFDGEKGPLNMIDGDPTTSFIYDDFVPGEPIRIWFNFEEKVQISSFKMGLAPTWSLRDPISWTLSMIVKNVYPTSGTINTILAINVATRVEYSRSASETPLYPNSDVNPPTRVDMLLPSMVGNPELTLFPTAKSYYGRLHVHDWPMGIYYLKYPGWACDGRNEVGTVTLEDDPNNPDCEYCAEATNQGCAMHFEEDNLLYSYEWNEATSKCQGSTSCTYAVGQESDDWDLYVKLQMYTEEINDATYEKWISTACPGLNELGTSKADDFVACEAKECGDEPECVSFEYAASNDKCQGSKSCVNANLEASPTFFTYIHVPELMNINGRFYRKYPGLACSGRNELGDASKVSVSEAEAQLCQGANDNCVSFEFKDSTGTAQASTSCVPESGITTGGGSSYDLYVYAGKYD